MLQSTDSREPCKCHVFGYRETNTRAQLPVLRLWSSEPLSTWSSEVYGPPDPLPMSAAALVCEQGLLHGGAALDQHGLDAQEEDKDPEVGTASASLRVPSKV